MEDPLEVNRDMPYLSYVTLCNVVPFFSRESEFIAFVLRIVPRLQCCNFVLLLLERFRVMPGVSQGRAGHLPTRWFEVILSESLGHHC